MPSAVKRFVPGGARSCFYGRFVLPNTKTQFAVHLLNLSPPLNWDPHFPISHFRLQMFAWDTSGIRLLNNIAVNYRAMVNWPKVFSAQLLWLDPKHQKMPILKFDCFVTDGFEGLIGDHVLVVLPKGLMGNAKVQSLAYGNWGSSGYWGQETSFGETDKRGLLQLRVTVFPASPDPNTEYLLRWNGKKFVIASSKNAALSTKKTGMPPFP